MKPIRTYSQAIRSIIVGLELIVLAAAMYLSSQPAPAKPVTPVEPAQPIAAVEPAQPITIERASDYEIHSYRKGIYLRPLRSVTASIRLLPYKPGSCHVGVRLSDDIRLSQDLNQSTRGSIFTFSAADVQISGDLEWSATVQFADVKLDFINSCDFASTDGG
jgi:hypothetical protein